VPVDGRNGKWILKLPHENLPNLPEVEYSIMSWARACGLPVPPTELVELAEVEGLPAKLRGVTGQAYLCKRFDRTDDGGRIHQEDFAQVLNVRPGDKYAERSHISYVQVARVLRQIAGPSAALMFARRIAFDIMCGNGDAHLKNWAVTYPDKISPVMTPVYDVVSTILFPGFPADLALSFVGTRKMQSITAEAFREFAKKAGISVDAAEDVAVDMARTARNTLESVLVGAPLSDDQKRALREHVAAMRLAR
jgi:serine/threonine-protein kinase HipA